MQKLPTLPLAFLLAFLLSGCIFPGVYKINVQQGNIVTDEELTSLKEGMPRSQVHALLGTPLLINPVDPSREYYTYTFQRSGGEIKEQRIIVYYDGDQFASYEAQLMDDTPAY
ncbi:outer membrane protein assembly factor BamE [Marinobacter sp. C2H3]|uniref:outer membrane protein assembly factor BamE n=1 Tax=Marinobacter sp. C2H3 TaxID=3119003 RepID=UPI00300E744A